MARSCAFWAEAGELRREGIAGVVGRESGREGFGAARVVRSDGVGARRRIFLEKRVLRGSGGSGWCRRPVLGVMRNFWWEGGMESWVWIWVDRSGRVLVEGRVMGWGRP